jgi:OFA family oxalate/formate antiporter-like MFS transporter
MKIKNRLGWRVTIAGIGINLALGILYSWSIIKGGIPAEWAWSAADKALPYAVCCFVFALSMIPAGRLQDRFGPRVVATIGGVFLGAGLMISAFAGNSLVGFVLGFGLVTGLGIGFAYASATPAAVKWFPKSKTGLIAGLVVAGFGLASVYIAPLVTKLLGLYGLQATLFYLGIVFLLLVVVLSQFIQNPPRGYVADQCDVPISETSKSDSAKGPELDWREMIKTSQFWVLWLMYCFGSATGLMIIGVAKGLGVQAMGAAAFWLVAVLALGNAGGRVLAGAISDRLGRQSTMFGFFILQSLIVLLLVFVQSQAALLLIIVAIAGANYGSNLALFPSITKDYFGLKNFGLNYGIMFTAWGVGGLILPRLNGMVIDKTGNSDITFFLAAGLMLFAASLTFVSRALHKRSRSRSRIKHGSLLPA